MTLEDIKFYAGLKTGNVASDNSIASGMVNNNDMTVLANIHWKNLFMEFVFNNPQDYEVEAHMDTTADQSEYDLTTTIPLFYEILYLGIKFSSSDSDYTRMKRREYNTLHSIDTDESLYQVSSPYYYKTSFKDTTTGKLTNSIGVVPVPETSVTDGLYMRYVEIPTDMASASDTPYNIPPTAHQLIALAMIPDIWEAQGDIPRSEQTMNRYLLAKKYFFENYVPMAEDEPARFVPDRSMDPIINDLTKI
jgi:hypothetical protein